MTRAPGERRAVRLFVIMLMCMVLLLAFVLYITRGTDAGLPVPTPPENPLDWRQWCQDEGGVVKTETLDGVSVTFCSKDGVVIGYL